MTYKGWTITTYQANGGFQAILVDTHGKRLDGPLCLPSPESAEHYAQKFINWYVRLEEHRRTMEQGCLR